MTFTVTCRNCGISFEAKRSTAKFHSSSCKIAYARKRDEKAEQVKEAVLEKTKPEALPEIGALPAKFLVALDALIRNRGKIIRAGYHKYIDIISHGITFRIWLDKMELIYGDMAVSYKLDRSLTATLVEGKKEPGFDNSNVMRPNPQNPYVKAGGSVSNFKIQNKRYRAFGTGNKFEG